MPNDQIGFYIELKVRPDHACKCVYIRSDDVPGLHLLGKCMDDMKPMVEYAIKRLYRDNNNADVNVIWLSNAEEFPTAREVPQRLAVYSQRAA
jgi:hypothetical protein